MKLLPAICLALAQLALPAQALSLDALQTGGFYADGGKNNLPSFQNYYVGYGTSPGLARTAERRSFFVFELPALAPGSFITGATLELRLPFGGLIFGKGPGEPGPGVPDDPFELFALTLPTVPAGVVLDSGLSVGEVGALFAMLGGAMPAADPYAFSPGSVPPPDPDGMGAVIAISLTSPAIAALNAAAGGSIVFGGWMPSWTEDLRPVPGVPGAFFEGSELIFGLTDVHAGAVPAPKLLLEVAVVPEPAAAILMLAGGLLILGLRRRESLKVMSDR